MDATRYDPVRAGVIVHGDTPWDGVVQRYSVRAAREREEVALMWTMMDSNITEDDWMELCRRKFGRIWT